MQQRGMNKDAPMPTENPKALPARPLEITPERAALTPIELLNNAVAGGADIEVLERLIALQERWETNQSRKAYDDAIAAAKAEIPVIRKNRRVGFASNRAGASRTDYAHEDLAEIARVVTPILGKYGLSYRFRTASPSEKPITVTCVITHRLGYYEENSLEAPRDQSGNKNAIQSIGSTVTYLQRYTLKAALGLAAEEDDDGKAAGAVELVSDEQAQAIRDKAESVSADLEKFCAYMAVDSVPGIKAKDFARAMAALTNKGKKKS
jgi:ERF superfamily